MIVPYDPAAHRRFVFSAWCLGAGEPFDRLHRILREGARCAVRVGDANPDVFMGYVVVAPEPQTIVWAYTKERLQGQGIMKALLEHLGVDRGQPMVALYRSPAAEALARKGWPIIFGDGAAAADERRDSA